MEGRRRGEPRGARRCRPHALSGLTLALALASAWLMSGRALAGDGAQAQAATQAATQAVPPAQATPAVRGGEGYTVHGRGAPLLVLQAGLGDGQESWAPLLPALSARHAVVALDRPGYGRVPLGDGPRDPCSVATEQHALLREAGLAPPYVLVGHSLGGLYQYVYARLYPRDVAGLVLVDATHPRHWAAMQAEAPAQAALVKGVRLLAMGRAARQEFDAQAQCLDGLPPRQADAPPVRLLFSGRPGAGENADFRRMLQGLRADWLPLTGAAPEHAQVVWDAGHYIHQERPDAVAAAVRAVAAQAGGRSGAQADAQSAQDGADAGVPAPGAVASSPLSRRLLACVPGRTTQAELRAAMGEPDEVLGDAAHAVWVYADPMDKVPAVASWLPIVGDVLDVLSLARTRQEWIVEFDARGVVTRQRLRPLP